MGQLGRAGRETRGWPGIYAHRPLDQSSIPDFEQAQSAIGDIGRMGRVNGVWCRLRSPATAGMSILTSSVMKHILDESPELGSLTLDELASKLRSSITTGIGDLCVDVTGTGVIEGDNKRKYLVATMREHPSILQDRDSLVRKLRGLGAVSLDRVLDREYKPHVTIAVFRGCVPLQTIDAVEAVVPTSFTVGRALVDVGSSAQSAVE